MLRRSFLKLTGLAIAGVAVGEPEVKPKEEQPKSAEFWLNGNIWCHTKNTGSAEVVAPILVDGLIYTLKFTCIGACRSGAVMLYTCYERRFAGNRKTGVRLRKSRLNGS